MFEDPLKITNAATIYAYSIIVYQILIRKSILIFSGSKNMTKVINNIKSGYRPDVSEIQSTYIVNFLKKCWAHNPIERLNIEEVIDFITNNDFYSYFQPFDQNSVKKYLDIFGDEFNHLKNKF